MRKYTIVDYFGYNLSPQDRMRVIRQAGFDGVILLWITLIPFQKSFW